MKTKIALFLILLSTFNALANSGFRENIGQIHNEIGQPAQAVRFLLHCKGFNVQLRKDGFSYDFYVNNGDSVTMNRVDFVFANFNPDYTIRKELPSQPYITTFVSDDKNPSFEKIIYAQFYPGIDLVFKRKNDDQFEYDFVITENGNINDIRFNIYGAEILDIQPTAIMLKVPLVNFNEWIPLSYDRQFKKVNVEYQKIGENLFKFFYQGQAKELTIDPTPQLIYATYSGDEWTIYKSLFLDNGDYVCAGLSSLPQNIATENSYQNQLLGETDATLCRFDASNNLVWFTYFGGNNSTSARDMFIKGDLVAIGGSTNSTELPALDGFQPNFGGGTFDVFYALFDLSGNFLQCSYLGGSNEDHLTSIVPATENILAITGNTRSQNFPVENSTTEFSGGQDGFATFFNIDNGFCLHSSVVGGSVNDFITGLLPTEDGKLLFFGSSNSTSLNQTGPEPLPAILHSQNSSTASDGIIGVFNEDLTLEFVGFYGGQGGESLFQGALNSEGKFVLISREGGTDTPFTSNAEHMELEGTSDGMIITVFDTAFNIEYRSLLCPSIIETNVVRTAMPTDLFISENNEIYIGGRTNSDVLLVTPDAFQDSRYEYPFNTLIDDDGFLIKLSSNGYMQWVTYLGASYTFDQVLSIDLLNSKLLISGELGSDASYPEEYQYSFVTPDAFQTQLNTTGGYIAIFEDVVNVNEAYQTNDFLRVYPNPASENIFVETNTVDNPTFFINDITGKRILTGNLNVSSISIGQLPKGMYTLSIQGPQDIKTTKFVKQ